MLLALAWYAGQILKMRLAESPPREASTLELALALLSFVLASGGATLLIHGPGLSRAEPRDRRRRP